MELEEGISKLLDEKLAPISEDLREIRFMLSEINHELSVADGTMDRIFDKLNIIDDNIGNLSDPIVLYEQRPPTSSWCNSFVNHAMGIGHLSETTTTGSNNVIIGREPTGIKLVGQVDPPWLSKWIDDYINKPLEPIMEMVELPKENVVETDDTTLSRAYQYIKKPKKKTTLYDRIKNFFKITI